MMVDHMEPVGMVKRERDTAAWAFRMVLMLALGLVGWIGIEIKADTKSTGDAVTKIGTALAVTSSQVGRHETAIDKLREDLRLVERRQDLDRK